MTQNKSLTIIPPPSFSFTLFTASEGARLNKGYILQNSKIESAIPVNFSEGKFQTFELSDIEQFNKGLDDLQENHALCIGTSIIASEGQITSQAKEHTGHTGITRTKDNFKYSNCFFFDIDKSSLKIEDVIPALRDVDPTLSTANLLVRTSSSTGIALAGEKPIKSTYGYHVWVCGVKDPDDIERYGKDFAKRCWLQGKGSIQLSKTGAMLTRQLIDEFVFSPERLVFEAKPTLDEGIVQLTQQPIIQKGVVFDTAQLPRLNAEELTKYQDLIEEAKLAVKNESDNIRGTYIKQRVQDAVANGTDEALALKHVNASLELSILYDSHLLYFKHEKNPVSVAEVLANSSSYNEKTLADPMEPDYNNSKTVAKFYANADLNNPIIRSFAHGDGKTYQLKLEVTKQRLSQFSLIPSTELTSQQKINDWLIKGLLERDAYGLIFGVPASGKSLIALDMAFCVATGLDWFGHKTKQGGVVYIAGEGFAGLSRRIKALELKYNCTAKNLLISQAPAALMHEKSAKDVQVEIEKICPDAALVIIDTLHRNFGSGDENSSKDFGIFTNNIDKYIRINGKTVLVVHHSGHGNADRGRGSSSIKASMDIEYKVAKEQDIVTMSNTKAKDIDEPEPLNFKIISKPLGSWMDEDGDVLTSVILEATNATAKTASLKPRDLDVLNELKQEIADNGIEPDDGIKKAYPKLPVTIKVIHQDIWRDTTLSTFGLESPDSQRKAFSRSKKSLIDGGKVQCHDDYCWNIPEKALAPITAGID